MSDHFTINLDSISATQKFASEMAAKIQNPCVIAMTGDLGSGKTTFTQGFARGMGIKDNVGSPTFKLVSEYKGEHLLLNHVDCYRLENEKDFFNIGGEKYLEPDGAITIIEWSEKITNVIPWDAIIIDFKRIPEKPDVRILMIEGWTP
ncbi:MAG TPA: tRNA (adenosine(37)-N6)-threonylcarbamoyltransferase complex ATPase subunit type 1 TsaE [Candidatus Marinimicrobia bacterium]|jgi:tRNA threonylcarbamoyladenosine biosynthesis protein TsaE|nr:tRNA (adenosine(37)-N6)-threonylcarbamoyltransferase complex ATPase subunit type 1 TsaE [Candidatus Neomarinimicrobiota bacterium]